MPASHHNESGQCYSLVTRCKSNGTQWVHDCLGAYVLGAPAISYLATLNKYYDYDFQGLPTKLSYQCFNFQELTETLSQILRGDLGAAEGQERQDLIDYYLAARDGPFACERIIDVLEASGYNEKQPASQTTRHLSSRAAICQAKGCFDESIYAPLRS